MADDSVYNTGSTITWLLPRRGVGQIKGGFSWLKGEQSSFQNVWGGQIGALLICGQVFLSPRDYRADHSSYLALGLLKFFFSFSPLFLILSSNFIFWVVVVGFKFTFFRVVLHELDFSVLADGHHRYEPLIYFGQKTNSRTHIRDRRAASISPLARSHKNLPKADLIFNVQVYTTYANCRLSYSPTIDGSEPLKMAFKLYPPAHVHSSPFV